MNKVWEAVNVDGDIDSLRTRLNDLQKQGWVIFSILLRKRFYDVRGYTHSQEYWTVIGYTEKVGC